MSCAKGGTTWCCTLSPPRTVRRISTSRPAHAAARRSHSTRRASSIVASVSAGLATSGCTLWITRRTASMRKCGRRWIGSPSSSARRAPPAPRRGAARRSASSCCARCPPPDALPADLRVVRVNITTTYLKTPPRSDGSVGGIGGGALDATSGGDGWLARWSASTSRAPPTPAANADRPVVRRQRVRLRGTPGAYSPVLQTWWSSAGEIRSHMTEKAISIEDYESALTQRRDPDSATIENQI